MFFFGRIGFVSMATVGLSLPDIFIFFVLAYVQQQGIPRNTLGVPSQYYTPKSGHFLAKTSSINSRLWRKRSHL